MTKKPDRGHVSFRQEKLQLTQKPELATTLKTLLGGDAAAYAQFLEKELAAAFDFVKRELEYHDALDDLSANEIDPYDIIDQAILAVLEEKPNASLKLDKRLRTKILEILHRTVADLEERERRETSLEDNVQDPAEEAGFRTLSEHVLDFWQPDQDLTMADVIPDEQVPTPAEIEDMKERQADIYKALGAMPQEWREDFVLFAVEHWKPAEIAEWRSIPALKVKEELRSAQKFLMERLREKGELENRPPHQPPHLHDRG